MSVLHIDIDAVGTVASALSSVVSNLEQALSATNTQDADLDTALNGTTTGLIAKSDEDFVTAKTSIQTAITTLTSLQTAVQNLYTQAQGMPTDLVV